MEQWFKKSLTLVEQNIALKGTNVPKTKQNNPKTKNKDENLNKNKPTNWDLGKERLLFKRIISRGEKRLLQ